MSGSASVLQLHRGDLYPPSNGEEVRVWETAKKLSEFGTVTLAHPDAATVEHPGVEAVDTANPFLEYKATRIYAWYASFAASADNWLDRLQARRTVEAFDPSGSDAGRIRSVSSDTDAEVGVPSDADFDVICCENPQMLRAGVRLAERHDAGLLLNKHNAMYDLLDQQFRLRSVPETLRRRAVRNLREFEQWGIDAADAVVFQSEGDAERFHLPDETVVEVIPNGTDFEGIDAGASERPEQIREELGIPPDATVCVFVGAFDYDPNEVAADLVREELAPELPGVEFLLVGRDPPDATRGNVHAPGYVEDLPGVLDAADVALCPLTMGSGTKLKMLDYLAAGLPVVTTDVGAQGLPLEDGETALIRNSREEFVAGVEALAESEELRASLAANGRRLGREFSWDALFEAYDPVLDVLLGERPLSS